MGSFPETYYRFVLSPALKQRLDATRKCPIHYPDKKWSLSSPSLNVCLKFLKGNGWKDSQVSKHLEV